MSDDVHDINDQRARERAAAHPAPVVTVGQVLWLVPTRWWEPEDYSPERCTVLTAGPQWDAERPYVFGLYVHHDGYGHPVYVDGVACFDTEADAVAEMTQRHRMLDALNDAAVEAILRDVLDRPDHRNT